MSGNSSKLDVSSKLLTLIGSAAGLSLMWSQSTPLKNGCDRISSNPPLVPILLSDSQQNLETIDKNKQISSEFMRSSTVQLIRFQ